MLLLWSINYFYNHLSSISFVSQDSHTTLERYITLARKCKLYLNAAISYSTMSSICNRSDCHWCCMPLFTGWSFSMGSAYQFHSWRVFVVVCALPCVCAVVALTFMPESPRFYLEVMALPLIITAHKYSHWYGFSASPCCLTVLCHRHQLSPLISFTFSISRLMHQANWEYLDISQQMFNQTKQCESSRILGGGLIHVYKIDAWRSVTAGLLLRDN